MTVCKDCPKECGVSRTHVFGACGAPLELKVARAALHYYEEPPISGSRGSGTVFFSHCNLRCVFCQNHEISAGGSGKSISATRLADVFRELEDRGAHNINLVSPTQYRLKIMDALDIYRPKIPIVYNTNSYERQEAIKELDGYVDIYLADLKYFDADLSKMLSGAQDYYTVAIKAATQMRQQKQDKFIDGLMKSGLIIRHLVLPGHKDDSFKVLNECARLFPDTLVSIMGQYYPAHKAKEIKGLDRCLTTFEYNAVKDHAVKLGIKGYFQQKAGSSCKYTPAFDLSGVE